MALHRLTALALAGVLALGVSACGDDTPPPKTPPGTTPASASPSPTGPVAPVLPELAKREDAVGAKAFVKHWFRAVTYAMQTGDTEAVGDVSSPDCTTCTEMQKNITTAYADGGSMAGKGWRISRLQDVNDRPDGAHVFVFVIQAPQKYLDAAGAVIDRLPEKKYAMEVLAQWDEGWTMREVALL